MSRTFATVLGSMWFVWAYGASALAYEDQASLDAELSYAHAVSDTAPPHGIALGLGASLGLTEVWSLRGQFAWSVHPDRERTRSTLLLSGELLYMIDIVELVPYFGAGIDAVGGWASGDALVADFGVHPVLGMDWLLSRELALGLQLRSVFILSALETDAVFLKAGVSLSYFLEF